MLPLIKDLVDKYQPLWVTFYSVVYLEQTLEQEKYSLQMKLTQVNQLKMEYEGDIETMRSSLDRQKQEHQIIIDSEHIPKISALKQQVNCWASIRFDSYSKSSIDSCTHILCHRGSETILSVLD